MFANTITLFRIFSTFGTIALFGQHRHLDIALIFAIALIFILDAVDGYIARKYNETSEIGALLDTTADRIIENTFWIYFTTTGQLPLWMSITVMTRGILTDMMQRTHGYPQNGWTYALTRSRISRGLYGTMKMFTFTSLISAAVFNSPVLEQVSLGFAILTVAFCLIRALPTAVEIYKTIGEKKTYAKCFRQVSQSTERLTREPSISKKTVR